MKAFSLFSGIGGFDKAMVDAGIEIVGHSEIDTKADAIYAKHFSNPNYGDITKIVPLELPDFDLLVFGSPCTDLSISNNNRTGLAGARSGLFYNAVDILQAKKPKFFIMENVFSMDEENRNIISNTLGVMPIMISSALLSAQNRKRLYWVGRRTDDGSYETVPVTLPEDKHIYLSDIMEKQVDEKYYLKNQEIIINNLLENHSDKMEMVGKIMRDRIGSPAQADRIYDPLGKSSSLTALAGGLGGKTGLYLCLDEQSNNDNLVFALTEARTEEAKQLRRKIRQETGNDFSPRRGKELQPRTDGKANCITATVGKEHYVFQNVRIRRLTPLETERLQGFPDLWTDGFSDSTRYKGTGNAVTVPVISHILKFIVDK